MAIDTNAALLGRVPLFDGLTQEQLVAILDTAKKTFFETDELITRAGEVGDTAYLILSGRAIAQTAEDDESEPLRLEAGAFLGELVMLVDAAYTLTVTAQGRVRALAISRKELLDVMEADPSIAHHLSSKLIDRLAALAHDLRVVDAKFAALEATLDKAIAAAC